MEEKTKKKFKTATILTIIGYVLLIIGICLFIPAIKAAIETQGDISQTDDVMGGTSTIMLFVAEVLLVISFFFNRSYRKENKKEGIKSGKVSTFVYVVTIIGALPAMAAILISLFLYAIFGLICHATESIGSKGGYSSSSSNPEDKKYLIKDERGYTQELEWDKYTKTYRDSSGNHYETKDGGNTFRRK